MKKLIVFVVDISDKKIVPPSELLRDIWAFSKKMIDATSKKKPKILIVLSTNEKIQVKNPEKNDVEGIELGGEYNMNKGFEFVYHFFDQKMNKYPNKYEPQLIYITFFENKEECAQWENHFNERGIVCSGVLFGYGNTKTLPDVLLGMFPWAKHVDNVNANIIEPNTDTIESDTNITQHENANIWSSSLAVINAIMEFCLKIIKKNPLTISAPLLFIGLFFIIDIDACNNTQTINNININIDDVNNKLEVEKDKLRDSVNLVTNIENYESDINITMKFESVKNTQIQKHSDDCNDCNYLELEYTLVDSIADYELGIYNITSTPITEISARYLQQKIAELSEQYYFKGGIIVEIDGEADANPILEPGIRYLGEYGAINGELYLFKNADEYKHIFKSRWAQDSTQKSILYIQSNEELAFMRAYAFADFLRKEVDLFVVNKPGFQYTAKENTTYGGAYRKIVIKIRFNGVYEKIKG